MTPVARAARGAFSTDVPLNTNVGASTVSAPVKAAPRAARCSRDDRPRLGRHGRLPGRSVPDRRDRLRARGDDRRHLPAAGISRPGCSHATAEVRAADPDPLPDRDGAAAWRLRLSELGAARGGRRRPDAATRRSPRAPRSSAKCYRRWRSMSASCSRRSLCGSGAPIVSGARRDGTRRHRCQVRRLASPIPTRGCGCSR